MISIFGNRKTNPASQNEAESGARNRIDRTCIKWKLRFALCLQRYTERLSRKSKIIVLLVFVSLAISYSCWVIAVSLSNKAGFYMTIASIKKPQFFRQSGDENLRALDIISKDEFKNIQKFRIYMDSLTHSPSGKKTYDKIITTRPHLTDSITIIEKLYQSQTKN